MTTTPIFIVPGYGQISKEAFDENDRRMQISSLDNNIVKIETMGLRNLDSPSFASISKAANKDYQDYLKSLQSPIYT